MVESWPMITRKGSDLKFHSIAGDFYSCLQTIEWNLKQLRSEKGAARRRRHTRVGATNTPTNNSLFFPSSTLDFKLQAKKKTETKPRIL